MLKRLVNECSFCLTLSCKGPLLIKEGRYEKPESDKKMPDSFFLCRNTPDEMKAAVERNDFANIRFYIPGSSLRGVIRSHAEMIVRTLTRDDPICCIPHNNFACDKGYKDSCMICKLFGSTGGASRISIHDSEIIKNGNVTERYGIAIDRFTGGVSESEGHGMLFKHTPLENYHFKSHIIIRNFEIWQLGLLAYVLRDFNIFTGKDEPGLITIGSGKNKGFGRVKGSIEGIWITYYDKDIKRKSYELIGIGEINTSTSDDYGFIKNDQLLNGLLHEAIIDDDMPYKKRCKVKDNYLFFKACATVWNKAITEKKFKPVRELRENDEKGNDL